MTSSYMAHKDLPRPALFKSIQKPQNELPEQLQGFLDAHSGRRFTIDDDSVGRSLVCAIENDVKGIMLYSMKQEIREYMEKKGFQCSDRGGVIQCTKDQLNAKL
jgi:hypothetical protein